MRVARGYRRLGLELDAPAVTIGNFDGVHLGHQEVMRSAVNEACRRGVQAVACTFDPHTLHVLRPAVAPPLLQTLDQRLAAIGAVGVDVAVVIPFDQEVAATPPEDFVREFLIGELHVGSLHLSKGFSFGRGKAGDRAYLERRGADCGFRVERVPAVILEGDTVSSTRIRGCLARGDVGAAGRLLGRPFALDGEVVQGAGRGKRIGARTANLRYRNGCVPRRGVYVTRARIDAGVDHPAVTNVGSRPTFETSEELVVESHLLDYGGGPLYGRRMELQFLHRLRGERRFPSADALAQQIEEDVRSARAFLAESLGASASS